MKRKILTTILMAGLTMSLFAGCGQQEAVNIEDTQIEETLTESAETELPEVSDTAETATEVVDTEAANKTGETEPLEEPTEESKAATEPVEEPVPQYTYTEINKTMYAASEVNLRDMPSTDGNKIGRLNKAEEVTAISQCNETSWYMILYNGEKAFVSNQYLSETKPAEEAAPAPTIQAVSNACPYELYTWYDMGWYQFILCESLEDARSRYSSLPDDQNIWIAGDVNPVYKSMLDRFPEAEMVTIGSMDTKWKNHAVVYTKIPMEGTQVFR